jgi:hypothetical protein
VSMQGKRGMGVKHKEDANGPFAHSTVITVLDTEDEIVHQQTGLSLPTDDASEKLNILSAK